MKARTAEHPRPDFTLLHLSDTHLVAEGVLYGDVDSGRRLREILADIGSSGIRPDALVFSGDLVDRGEATAYDALRAMVEPIAAEIGATVVWAMGNHDDRAQFRSHLLDTEPSSAPVDLVHDIDGLRVVVLDTTVPGYHHGEITDAQLAWLADVLATPARYGTVLVMHHPPIPAVLDLSVLVELFDQRRLAEVVRGSDIRTILSGHLHHSTSATFAGIGVSVVSATSYTQDLAIPVGAIRGRDGAQSHNLVSIYPDTVVHSVVPMRGQSSVGEAVSATDVAQRLRDHEVTIVDSARSRSEPAQDSHSPAIGK
ncbi:metallophosphoesterase [Williamsia sp. MIQD14]|uniref:metallophosphoesterase n=1 Tax=unclassified Williamsia TaxID=2636252 RepID=UPI0006FBE74F|nr:metallophosphoesterase [Williamsia sp. Leaf354]KQR99983.1 3',5'-cyclic-nucleotide phosphodiesterase [Williamsia sp. Leaf354]MCX6468977.1 metallophosphoesterase [Mycobacteriales bacterium]